MKSKVTKITKMDKKDTYGNTSFSIEFENGEKGFYTSKNEDQKKFVVGQESEFTLEAKSAKNGGTYNKIVLPQVEQKQFGKVAIDPRINMISFSMSYTKDLVCAGKVDMKELESVFERVYKTMTAKI